MNAPVTRSARYFIYIISLSKLPDQGMLAASAANDEDFQVFSRGTAPTIAAYVRRERYGGCESSVNRYEARSWGRGPPAKKKRIEDARVQANERLPSGGV